jgi:molybdate/tungstate transport system substrate-binding protein
MITFKSRLLLGAAVLVLAAGCSSSSKTSAPTSASTTGSGSATTADAAAAPAHGSGPVDVLYAGSLVNVMEKQIGPAFNAATGFTFTGFSAGSTALATQIKGKVRQGDVFISASPAVNKTLMGPSNGNWVSWYVTFANSPLVIGYNPHSKFAHDLQTKPWYSVITEPGFLIGRTDPATDPKGKLTVMAIDQTAQKYNEPDLKKITSASSNVYPEETLVGRLQSGQLDAGFFYTSETTPAGIPTVELTGVDLKATYTATVLNQAPHQAGGEAFVSYLLSPSSQAILTKDGFHVVRPPTVTGTGVPSTVSSAVSG